MHSLMMLEDRHIYKIIIILKYEQGHKTKIKMCPRDQVCCKINDVNNKN